MIARVLGSAAGGGFPQWNCACPNCAGVRAGRIAAVPRTQASLAVSGNDHEWLLLGASPDVRAQIEITPELWPRPPRSSPIVAVALPNGDVDAWLGLLSLREWSPLVLLATEVVRRDLAANPVVRTLGRFDGQLRFVELVPGARHTIAGLDIEAVLAPGKPPLHMARRRAPDPLDNVGFVLRDEHSALAWFPSVAGPSEEVERALTGVDALFFDGTFYRHDELAAFDPAAPGARAMGHWPIAGPDGSAAFLARLPAPRKWLVHVNNTNPLLVEDSAARGQVRSLGLEVAYDGLEWRS